MYDKILLLTLGDVAGVGPEIIFKLLPQIKSFIPVIISEKQVVNYFLRKYNFSVKPLFIKEDVILSTKIFFYPKNNFFCIPIEDTRKLEILPGKPTNRTGISAIRCIDKAIEVAKKLIAKNKFFSLLTMPVSKEVISHSISKEFIGHTEYIAGKLGIKNYAMLMIAESKISSEKYFNVLLITRHIPLKDVSSQLNVESIVSQVLLAVSFLEKNLDEKVEILICGLNPHLGENGKIGKEEVYVLRKVVNCLSRRISNKVICPVLTEKAFEYAKGKKNVLIVCLYHDQAMVPLKLLSNKIANVTIGLPFVRVSPGHGTAFDIAGKRIASIDHTKFCVEILDKYKLA